MKIIYHIFKADTFFHSIDIIDSTISKSKFHHYFLIVGINCKNRSVFDKLFTAKDYKDYKYFYDSDENINCEKPIVQKLYNIVGNYIKKYELDILKYICKNNLKILILHSNYSTLFYLILSFYWRLNKNWYCWGSIFNKNKSIFRKILLTAIYMRIYKSFNNIICTMEPDCIQLKTEFNVKNVHYLPYLNINTIETSYLEIDKKTNDRIKIVLGNSGQCLESYYQLIEMLKRFINKDITIDCLLNYGGSEFRNIDFINYSKTIYGRKIKAHTSILAKDDYVKLMKEFDIYISSVTTQSGLGAIYLMLKLGKKVFLAGSNYQHIKNLGAIVFHSDTISELSFDVFSTPLTINEKRNNYEIINNLKNCEILSIRWENFYSQLGEIITL